jgi:hypothetical protein
LIGIVVTVTKNSGNTAPSGLLERPKCGRFPATLRTPAIVITWRSSSSGGGGVIFIQELQSGESVPHPCKLVMNEDLREAAAAFPRAPRAPPTLAIHSLAPAPARAE